MSGVFRVYVGIPPILDITIHRQGYALRPDENDTLLCYFIIIMDAIFAGTQCRPICYKLAYMYSIP